MSQTRIGMVLFPRLTQLDLTGPYEERQRIITRVARRPGLD